ncbi:MAG: HYR domain-containing protein [Bacteroidetes bacterium]|nr:HYR domain-containing protein [Bacteroidota bacterium]
MRIQHYLSCLCLLLLGVVNLQAQTQYIGPDNGSWFTAANWNNGLPAAGNDALIGGGVTVAVGSPLTVNFGVTAFGNISATAAITIASGGNISNSGTLTIASTSSLTNNGTLSNFGTLTFNGTAGFTNGAGANFTNGGSFTLQTTLVNSGAITNNGTIDATNGTLQSGGTFDNNQTLTTKSLTINASSTFTNNFGATVNITGATGVFQVNGNVTNNGIINASGAMTVNGNFANNVSLNVTANSVLTVNAGAQLNNGGTVDNSGFVQNYGTLTNGQNFVNRGEANNFATFNNNNLIDNKTGATFYNRAGGTLGMGFGSKISNAGTFNNLSDINSFGTIENNGTYTNSGNLLSFGGSLLDNNSTFTNSGSISTNDVVSNDGSFTNSGTINVNGGSVWSNNASFTNAVGGTVNVVQDFVNNATGTLTNNGTFRNTVRTQNLGSFVNNAYLHNPGDFTNSAGGTLTNNELFLLEAGNLLNAGAFVNKNKTLSDECSSIKNTGSINNTGGNLEIRGIFFQKGTLTGNAVNNTGGYTHTGATSDAPTVCQNGTFGANIDGDIKVYANAIVAFENFDSCANIVYLANGIARPVFHCSDIPTVQNVNLVIRTRLGDSLTCVAQVTPVDLLEPQIAACPKDQVIFTPNPTATATWTAPTASDNCSSTVSVTSTHNPGASFPVGITGVTYTFKDQYNNQNQCQFRIDVRQTPPGSNCTGDTAGPTFTGCPTNQTIQQLGILTPASWTPPTPNDNCKPINLTSTHVPGQGFPVGTTTVTYTAKDGSNNSSTCTFTIKVNAVDPCLEDTQKPVISGCPANIWLPTNTAINGAVAIWSAPGAGDNCGVTSLTASHVPGNVYPVGTTTVTYTAKDAANNTATCSFTITVGADPCPGDVTAPAISGCPSNISLLTTGNTATATWTAPTATDNCAPVTVNATHTSGSTFGLGSTPVTYQFSDKKGNKSTCTFTVTVQNSCSADNVPPVITGCPSNITVAAVGASGATATWTAPTATDNCSLTSFTSSYLPGANFPLGVTTVVYTAIDLQGNASNCSFNVAVVSAPNCTTNAAPINNTTGVDPASVALSWTTAANASSYDVYLGTANPPTTVAVANVSGTSTTVTNLAAGTTYYWFVVPKNAAGSATGCSSSVTNFSTAGSNGGGPGSCNVTTGSIVREVWNTNTWNLNDIDGFGNPNNTVNLTQFAITSTENGTNYSDRVRGYLVPSQTGNYRFNVTGDDYTELFLSSSANPANKQKIAYHYGYTGTTEYNKYSTQTSSTVALTAGEIYYVELRHLEGGGADHFRVSWKTPSNSNWNIVPGSKLAPYTDIISPNAVCQNLTLQLTATGQSVQISGQQVDNGSTPGCGATFTSMNVSPTSFSQPGTYTVTLKVTNSFGLSSTCTSTVTVLAPPCNSSVTAWNFTKVDGTTLFALVNNGSYTTTSLPSSYNIEALVSGSAESVKFTLSGPVSMTTTENFVPYHVAATGGSMTLTPGTYTLNAKLYSQDNAQGTLCNETTITFKIVAPCSVTNTVCEANVNNGGWYTLSNCTLSVSAGDDVKLSVNPNGLASYQWSGPNGYTATGNNGGDAMISNSITAAQAGTYTVTMTDANGCTAAKSIAVSVCSMGATVCEANINNTGWQVLNNCAISVCTGDNVVLSVNPNGLASYQWSGPGGYTANGNSGGDALISSSITTAKAGTYTVTMTDAGGCTAVASINLTVTACSACSDNLLVNEGFENGTAGWTWMQNAGTTTSSPFAGAKSLSICSGSGGISQGLPVLPGETYTLKVYAKISGASASVGIRFYDSNWNEVGVPSVSVNSTSYKLYTVSGTAPVNAAYVEAWAWKNNNGCFYADAFCLSSTAGFPACSNSVLANENPGFEYNFNNWDWTSNASITSTSHSGSKGAKVCTSWNGGGAGNQVLATPGATYSLQLWAQISGSPNWAGAGMAFYDANWHKIGGDISRTITSNDWALYLIQGVAPINAKYVDFWFWKDAGGCMYVDDFCATSTGGGCDNDVLFVVGSTWLNSGDAWVKNRLEQLGLDVTVKSANYVSTSDANGKGLVVISSTINSGDVTGKFKNVAVPVVTWESYILDDMKMTGSVAQTDYGQNSSYNSITITDPSHPLAAGLSGTVKVLEWSSWFRWGWTTQSSAAKVAKVAGQEAWYGIFGFDKGQAMQGGFIAPERRVSLFMDDETPAYLTSDGKKLFDNAIEWAIRCHLASATGSELAVRNGEAADHLTPIAPNASVQVFPNPAEDRIFVEFGEGYNNDAANIRLFDINGKAIKEWEMETSGDSIELPLDGLRSGQYLLWIAVDGKAPISKRIVVATTK